MGQDVNKLEAIEPQSATVQRRSAIPHLRWIIAVMLLLAAVLNYIDRIVLSLLAPTIQDKLHMSDDGYATVVNYFLVAYTIAYLLSGRVVDKLGVRLSMALFIGWWSISNALTGLARSVTSLSAFRFLLGLGEAGGYTASPKAVREWFPASERGIAVGMYSLGGAIGATIAPAMVLWINGRWGWQGAFAVTGSLGLVWLIPWCWLYRRPAEHPHITAREQAYLSASLEPATSEPKESEWTLWKRVAAEPVVWQLMFARLITDPVWYFMNFWMAKYLHSDRNVPQDHLTIMTWVFVAADAGFLLGGLFSGRLIKRQVAAPRARVRLMAISALLVPLAALIPGVPAIWMVIALAMLVAYGHAAWLTNISSLIVDIIPRSILGTAFGAIACGSALGGIFMNQVVAWMVKHYSYSYCFYLMLLVHPIALLVVWNLRKQRTA